MKTASRFQGFVQVAALLIVALFVASTAPAQEKPAKPEAEKPKAETKATTLDNLMTAYNGESNAQARYTAFAKKADEEGYRGVASLFRAAAHAEGLHAKMEADAIKKLGGTPKADVKTPDVKSTKENLEAAIKGESYEKDKMYPEFLKLAKEEKNKDATTAFNYAQQTEAGHAKLYQEALSHLDQWKAARDFYVCLVCGNTVEKVDFEKCPVCFSPKSKYEKAS